MQIGIALSGGGVRATVFHLGVLARLAKQDLLEDLSFISTVSGGTLCIGLVHCHNDLKWPASKVFLDTVEPKLRELLTNQNLQCSYLWRALFLPWRLFKGRAKVLASAMEAAWAIGGDLSDLPHHPRWIINATTYETGKNWRFDWKRMGDYLTNYVPEPRFPLAWAMATSAAVPGVIGPLSIRTGDWSWVRFKGGSTSETEPATPQFQKLHLWDGGIYENLGVEALFKPKQGYREGVEFLIVSDASQSIGTNAGRFLLKPVFRLVDIAMDQVRSLRARMVVSQFGPKSDRGAYFRMGNTAQSIVDQSGSGAGPFLDYSKYLSNSNVENAASTGTTLRRLSQNEYERLFRHGFETANVTLFAYQGQQFPNMLYDAAIR